MRITLPSLMLLTSLGGIARLPAQGVFYGTVRDQAGGPVLDASVGVDSAAGPLTRTDSTGGFTLCELPAGPLRITVGMAGFAPFRSPVMQVGASDTIRLDVRLTPLPSAVVEADRKHRELFSRVLQLQYSPIASTRC